MAIHKFDELNNLRSMPFEQYFGEMGISDEEKERRIAIAEDWDDVLMYILALMDTEYETRGERNSSFLVSSMEAELFDVMAKYTDIDDEYVQTYIHDTSENVVNNTLNHLDDIYYTSEDRVRYVAENEANTVGNYIEYQEKADKYTYKIWMSCADDKVRDDHMLIDHQEIPIDELFVVGNSTMRFPKDTMYDPDPEELINCRCWCLYR